MTMTLGTLDSAPAAAGSQPADPDHAVRIRTELRLGLAIILIVFGGLAAWSILAPLQGAVLAQGEVTVASNRQTVQHLEGGIVAEILVEEGEIVAAGAPLFRLDRTAARAELASLDTQIVALEILRARLVAERDGDAWLQLPDHLAERDDPVVLDLILAESDLLAARRDMRVTELALLDEQAVARGQEIEGLQQQLTSVEAQIVLIADQQAELEPLIGQGLVRAERVLELARTAVGLEGEQGRLVSTIGAQRAGLAEIGLQRVRLADETLREVTEMLSQVDVQLTDLRESRMGVADEVARQVITAPRAGQVVGRQVHTPGAVITGSQVLLEIVPTDETLIVEAQVPTQEVDQVTQGQAARLRFTSFDQDLTPEFDAAVLTVGANAMADEATGFRYYPVRLSVDGARGEGDVPDLRPGMPVDVMITTDQRSAMSFLLKPLTDAWARAFRE